MRSADPLPHPSPPPSPLNSRPLSSSRSIASHSPSLRSIPLTQPTLFRSIPLIPLHSLLTFPSLLPMRSFHAATPGLSVTNIEAALEIANKYLGLGTEVTSDT